LVYLVKAEPDPGLVSVVWIFKKSTSNKGLQARFLTILSTLDQRLVRDKAAVAVAHVLTCSRSVSALRF
jgi:hypothetical protein